MVLKKFRNFTRKNIIFLRKQCQFWFFIMYLNKISRINANYFNAMKVSCEVKKKNLNRFYSPLWKHLPKSILYDGTQTSIKVFSASSIKQWYWNFAGEVQFWMTAKDAQFLIFALFSTSSFDSGQESTLTAVFFDQEQERLSHI